METKLLRTQLFDPYRNEYVSDMVPTISVKRCCVIPAGAGTHTLMATYTIGQGTVGLVTSLQVEQIPGARGACYGQYRVQDRGGTVSGFVLYGGTTRQVGRTFLHERGDRMSPIHTVNGTFGVSKSNAAALGTTMVSWEMIVSSGRPGREGTASPS